MAALNTNDLVECRRLTYEAQPGTWIKPEINAMLNAIDAWFDAPATRNAISSAIDTATTPKVFTAAEKRAAIRSFLRAKFSRGV